MIILGLLLGLDNNKKQNYFFAQQVPSGKAKRIKNRDDSKKQISACQSSAASEGAGGKASEVNIPNPIVVVIVCGLLLFKNYVLACRNGGGHGFGLTVSLGRGTGAQ